MGRLISILALGAMLTSAVPAAAQDAIAQPAPELATLEALCEANAANDDAKRLCLNVVREIMLPAPDAEPKDAEIHALVSPEPVVYGLGDGQDRGRMRIKPLKVDWNVPPATSWDTPRKGMKYVGVLVLVRHDGGKQVVSFDEWRWKARDRKGFSYDLTLPSQARPTLLWSDIEPGQTVRGWMTFEIPRNTRWLEIRQEQLGALDPLYWTIRDRKRK